MVYFKKLLFLTLILVLISSAETFSQVKGEVIPDTSKSDFSYNLLEKTFSKGDYIPIKNKADFIKELEKINFIKGTVYFVGSGFPNATVYNIGAEGINALGSGFDLCSAGTQINFDNCTIKNKDGSIIKGFNKSILFIP